MKQLCSFVAVLWLLNSADTAHAQVKQKPASNSKQQVTQTSVTEQEMMPVTPENGKEVIALYPFTTSALYGYDFALSAGNAVEAGFVRSKRFTVVERSRFGIIKEEEKFKEVNIEEAVKKASKLGAKILVTGHIIAVTTAYDPSGSTTPFPSISVKNHIAQISLSFKIIEVETGSIKKSETIMGKGKGTTPAEAMQDAYQEIDRLARAQVAEFLPQRFVYASEVEVDKKNRLKKFKIWGGSDQGLKEGDLIEIYELSYITNPATGKRIEEKKLRATAKVTEVNSTETATCELLNAASDGEQLLTDIKAKPESIVFEYKGTTKKKGLFQFP
jgi:curli biogenesis system outer membrane secretion channel CsgG